jgi:hypothetical protein
MLTHAVAPSRSTIWVATTDLCVIQWICVTRAQGTGEFSYRISHVMAEVKETLSWLVSQTPDELGVALPEFFMKQPTAAAGPSTAEELCVRGFLGSGAPITMRALQMGRCVCLASVWLSAAE